MNVLDSTFTGTGNWEDPAPKAYEMTLLAAFAHSILHPLALMMLHHPLRSGLKQCLIDSCCCLCIWMGMDFEIPQSPETARKLRLEREHQQPHELNDDNQPSHSYMRSHPRSHSPYPQTLHRSVGDLVHVPVHESLTMKRSTSLKSDRLLIGNEGPSSLSPITLTDDIILPPPPLPPATSKFRKQVNFLKAS